MDVALNPQTILIGDCWSAEGGSGTLGHINPSTGKVQSTVALGSVSEVDRAVAAGMAAFPAWSAIKADTRRAILLRYADMLEARMDEFHQIAALEIGQPVALRMSSSGPARLRYAAGWTDKIEGQITPVYPADALNYVHYEPYGVIAAISTWNGPIGNLMMKLSSALATGNCVVVKPAELAPYGVALAIRTALEAGIPPGVINMVTGGPEVGARLTSHPDIAKISFTGSITVARKILTAAAHTITPVITELGGKSANIIFADADLDNASAIGTQMGCIVNSGQGCVFPTRMLVQDEIYDAVVERVLTIVGKVRQGNPLDPTVNMGPVISAASANRIMGYIDEAKADGSARLLAGGERLGGELKDGFFVSPTIFGDVDNNSRIAQEEIFGPVLSIIRFRTEEEAIQLANATNYGLAGYVQTQDIKRAHRVAAQLQAGFVAINGFPASTVMMPFGGWRQSGAGKEGGRLGIEEFLRVKNIYLAL